MNSYKNIKDLKYDDVDITLLLKNVDIVCSYINDKLNIFITDAKNCDECDFDTIDNINIYCEPYRWILLYIQDSCDKIIKYKLVIKVLYMLHYDTDRNIITDYDIFNYHNSLKYIYDNINYDIQVMYGLDYNKDEYSEEASITKCNAVYLDEGDRLVDFKNCLELLHFINHMYLFIRAINDIIKLINNNELNNNTILDIIDGIAPRI